MKLEDMLRLELTRTLLNERKQLLENLTSTQVRCTKLVEEARQLRAKQPPSGPLYFAGGLVDTWGGELEAMRRERDAAQAEVERLRTATKQDEAAEMARRLGDLGDRRDWDGLEQLEAEIEAKRRARALVREEAPPSVVGPAPVDVPQHDGEIDRPSVRASSGSLVQETEHGNVDMRSYKRGYFAGLDLAAAVCESWAAAQVADDTTPREREVARHLASLIRSHK